MGFIKKNFWELFFTGGHTIFGLSDLVHEIIIDDLNWNNILSLNTFFEVGSTLFGTAILVVLFRTYFKLKSAMNTDN